MTIHDELADIWANHRRPWGGLNITVSTAAAKDTTERRFPYSRHRSARIHKKLVQRHGGVYKQQPAIFRMGNTIVCHPALYDELKRQLEAASKPRDYNSSGNPW